MEEITEFWNNKSTPAFAGRPKIIMKVACRGMELASPVKVRRGGGITFYHPDAENVHIYASMKGDAIYDNQGNGKGSYFVEALVEVMKNEKWNKESLYSMVLRMRRGVAKATCAREWIDFQGANSRKIFFKKRARGNAFEKR